MEKVAEIHAYHGWGFTGAFWSPWEELLPESIIIKKADRGYFGQPYEPDFDKRTERRILFLHSFGAHWCPVQKIREADIVVVFNGFTRFHPADEPAHFRSKKVVKGMQTAFQAYPEKVLRQFYENCFLEKKPDMEIHPEEAELELLSKDLNALNDSILELKPVAGQRWIIFDSGEDRILPGERGREIAEETGTEKYFLMKDAQHALPVQKIQECYKILSEELPIFGTQ